MRLVGIFDNEKHAFAFYSFLLKEKIESVYEPFADVETKATKFRIWVTDEDQYPLVLDLFEQFKEHPEDPRFDVGQPPFTKNPFQETRSAAAFSKAKEGPGVKLKVAQQDLQKRAYHLTHFILLLCIFLFIWDWSQEQVIVESKGQLVLELGFTPLQQHLIFDYPQAVQNLAELASCYPIKSLKDIASLPQEQKALFEKAEKVPYWQGLIPLFLEWHHGSKQKLSSIPLFEKIGQGEVWRLFTPCLLHRDFLHILFNMAWLFILGRQIEERVSRWRMILMILIIGVVANVAQYLMDGPFFLGFSGVIVGMAGFIWMRQKHAPWEGYPLQRATSVFIFLFVLAMFALELVGFSLQFFSVTSLSPNIANTAHIVGGVLGLLFGRYSFFSREAP